MKTAKEHYLTEIALLHEENEKLKAEVRYYRSIVDPSDKAVQRIRRVLDVPPQVARLAWGFLKRKSLSVVMLEVLSNHGEAEYMTRASRGVLIHKLRAALKPHNISIKTLHSWGYEISSDDQARLERMLDVDEVTS